MNTPKPCVKCGAPAVKVDLCLSHLRDAVTQWKASHGRCDVDGCSEPSRSRGKCKAHYQAALRDRTDGPTCADDTCESRATAKGYCDLHRMRLIRTGTTAAPSRPAAPTSCTTGSCNRKVIAKGLCRKHYDEARRATAAA